MAKVTVSRVPWWDGSVIRSGRPSSFTSGGAGRSLRRHGEPVAAPPGHLQHPAGVGGPAAVHGDRGRAGGHAAARRPRPPPALRRLLAHRSTAFSATGVRGLAPLRRGLRHDGRGRHRQREDRHAGRRRLLDTGAHRRGRGAGRRGRTRRPRRGSAGGRVRLLGGGLGEAGRTAGRLEPDLRLRHRRQRQHVPDPALVAYGSGTAVLYVDGREAGRNTGVTVEPHNFGNHIRAAYIGRSQYPDPYLKGAVDDFRVYGRTLTPAEVTALART
ncbi:LamG domain-containing protein [Streptomyces sp. NPDC005890]|uniref:LamG domain-containing protein n=1 Tax=Streptomyces sp. NPDC005890 TaxID=3154568 RepID=UPI00340AFD1F